MTLNQVKYLESLEANLRKLGMDAAAYQLRVKFPRIFYPSIVAWLGK